MSSFTKKGKALLSRKSSRAPTRFEDRRYGDFDTLDAQIEEWQKTAIVAAERAQATHERPRNEGGGGMSDELWRLNLSVAGMDSGFARRETGMDSSLARRETGMDSSLVRRETGMDSSLVRRETGMDSSLARRETGMDLGLARRDTIPTSSFGTPSSFGMPAGGTYRKRLAIQERSDPVEDSGGEESSLTVDQSEQGPKDSNEDILAQSLSQGGQIVARDLLSTITIDIMEAGQRFSGLRGTDRDDPVGAVRHVLRAFEDLANEKSSKTSHFRRGKSKSSKNSENWERRIEVCEKNLKASEAKLDASKKDISKLLIQRGALEEANERLERDKERIKQEGREKIEAMKVSNSKELGKWKDKAERAKGDLEHSERQHSRNIREHQDMHRREIVKIQTVHEALSLRAAEIARNEGASVERKHKEALEKKDDTLALERMELNKQIQAEKEEKERKLLAQQQRHDTEMAALRKQLDEKIQSFEQERLELKLAFAAQTQDLQRNNESLTGALVRRDHFKGLADSTLRARFSSLSVKLGTISFKADWDRNRENTWPCPENLLHRLCPKDTGKTNVRKLKQQIIQNSLWFILYYYVFSTPFRILGTSGKNLDEDWFGEFGGTLFRNETSEWPPATSESEKKRYEDAKSCLEAIQNSSQTSDENGEEQESYTLSVRQIVEHIREIVERVAHVDSGDEQRFEELVDESAKLWLEACSQRYRFRVTLPPGAEDVILREPHDFRAMNLIVKPGLVRWGNSQGQDLRRKEFLTDWAGHVTEYEYVESTA